MSVVVGDVEILPVLDGSAFEIARDVLTIPGSADPWACHADMLDDDGHLVLTLGGFLLRTGTRIILIDVGVGMIDNRSYKGGQFLHNLRTYGVEPDMVTDVLFTHLHFDHVGWATQQGKVVFPRATFRVHQADWDHFVSSPEADPRAVRKLSPLEAQLETFDSEVTLAPGLDARPTPGHTPGSTTYIVSNGSERALLLGDVVHSTVELTEPDWEAVFDVDPSAARIVRSQISNELALSENIAVAAHFPGLRFGRIITGVAERQWVFLD